MLDSQNLFSLNSENNLTFTENDHKASQILAQIRLQAIKDMPSTIFSSSIMLHYEEMCQHKLYTLMKTIPKGVLHHCHIECCEDKQYVTTLFQKIQYRQFVINDPIIYLNQEINAFRIGTLKQAQQNNWVSMKQIKKKFKNQQQLLEFVSNITIFNYEDHKKIASKQIKFWNIFQHKIANFFPILYTLHHFKSYVKHISQKFIKNGYDRLQWRALISELKEYDSEGNMIKVHKQQKYIEVLDQVGVQLKEKYPDFSFGVIFCGLKQFDAQKNAAIFNKVCELNWDKTIGFDLVQQEDPHGSLQKYDQVVQNILQKYPHLNYKKAYHAGQTKQTLNKNIQIAVKAGSVRIGHGTNILQRMEFLKDCRNVCFEINHISNLLSGLREDTRISSAHVLMSLGYALTINPDDPGKFGYEDTTVDYFSSLISFNWGLKELKLLAMNSIDHAICSDQEKKILLTVFNKNWDIWVNQLIQRN